MEDDALACANLLERIAQLGKADESSGDLYPAQWAALRYLLRANRFSRTPMALTRYFGTTRGTMSQTIIALERKGYVSREPSGRDKRSVDVALTPKGRAKLAEDPVLALADNIQQTLQTRTGSLRQMLESILAGLIRANEGRMFGQCRTCRFFERSGGPSAGQPHRCGLLKAGLSDEDSQHICVEHEAL